MERLDIADRDDAIEANFFVGEGVQLVVDNPYEVATVYLQNPVDIRKLGHWLLSAADEVEKAEEGAGHD